MISIILPTLNEAENLPWLIPAIFKSLSDAGITGEVIVVDDASYDGTAEVAEELSERFPVQIIKRAGRLGLATAVMEGVAVAQGTLIGIMDADGSHDPAILPSMIHAVQNDVDLAIGSRYVPGGGIGQWPFIRRLASKTAIVLAFLLTTVKDATSGYLVFKRSVIEGVTFSPLGFKIGLEIIVKGRYSNLIEIPYTFKDRIKGASKLGNRVIFQYIKHLFMLYHYQLSGVNTHYKNQDSVSVCSAKSAKQFWVVLFISLILFAFGVAIWNLGQAPLSDAEAFYAETAREMYVQKNWLVPHFNFARFFDKPPLYYWLEIAAYHIFGVNEFASRLPAAMAFVGLVGLTAIAGKLLFNNMTGLIAGFILTCSMGFYLYSHTVLVESVLAFFITGTLVSFLLWYRDPPRKWYLYILYACMALAMLTKGLTAIVFPGFIIGGFLFTAGSKKRFKQFLDLKAILCFVLIALPWHLWVAVTNKGFLWFYFIHEQLLRFLNLRQITDASLGTLPFLGTLLLILFPWSLFCIPAFLFCLLEWREGKAPAAPRWFLVLWATVVIGFFCLSKSKLEYYSLPAWPALALLVAQYWSVQLARPDIRLRGINISLVLLCFLMIIVNEIARSGTFMSFIPTDVVKYLNSYRSEIHNEILEFNKAPVQALRFLSAASFASLLMFWMRRPKISLLCLVLVMLPIFASAQKGILFFEPFLSSRRAAQTVGDCLNRSGQGKIVHEETDEDIYIGGISFYTKQKVWLLKSKEKQRFPFPLDPEEVYYLTPEEFLQWWNGPELVIFVGDLRKKTGRPWEHDKTRFYSIPIAEKQGIAVNMPVWMWEPTKLRQH